MPVCLCQEPGRQDGEGSKAPVIPLRVEEGGIWGSGVLRLRVPDKGHLDLATSLLQWLAQVVFVKSVMGTCVRGQRSRKLVGRTIRLMSYSKQPVSQENSGNPQRSASCNGSFFAHLNLNIYFSNTLYTTKSKGLNKGLFLMTTYSGNFFLKTIIDRYLFNDHMKNFHIATFIIYKIY